MKNTIKLITILILLQGIAWGQSDSNKVAAPAKLPVYTYVEQMPQFPNGQDAMMRYLGESMKYPKDAREKDIQGKVFITFVVNEEGKITDAKVLRGIGGGCDEEALRVIKAMPPWTPGKQNGRSVPVQYNLPINFKLTDDGTPPPAKKPEVMPAFPGGNEGLQKYLMKKLEYPDLARKNSVEGKVIVSFIVNEKGKIEDIKIKQSLRGDCDAEAIRVVKKMPKWKPGMMDGKPVKVIFNLPIAFKLQ